MHSVITSIRFSRCGLWGRALVAIVVMLIVVAGVSGCAQLGIPTAQTAPVEPAEETITIPPAPVIGLGAPSPVTGGSSGGAPGGASSQGSAASGLTVGALYSATVVRVVDGDTAVFRLKDGSRVKVRFIGVDTPESTTRTEPYGKAASAYTARKLKPGSKVYLEKDVEPRDRYGRLLAYVWLEKPGSITQSELRAKLFNAKLVLDGYAQQMTIPPNVKYADYFGTFAEEARFANKGLWAGDGGSGSDGGSNSDRESGTGAAAGAPATPGPSTGSASYIGNRNTMKFHILECSSVGEMNPGNKVALSSRDAAISGGYVPCGRCRP